MLVQIQRMGIGWLRCSGDRSTTRVRNPYIDLCMLPFHDDLG